MFVRSLIENFLDESQHNISGWQLAEIDQDKDCISKYFYVHEKVRVLEMCIKNVTKTPRLSAIVHNWMLFRILVKDLNKNIVHFRMCIIAILARG